MECLLALLEAAAMAVPAAAAVRLFPDKVRKVMDVLGFDGEPEWTRR